VEVIPIGKPRRQIQPKPIDNKPVGEALSGKTLGEPISTTTTNRRGRHPTGQPRREGLNPYYKVLP
jgi:hypothetical protein